MIRVKMTPQEVTWQSLSVDLEWGRLSGKVGVVGSKDSMSSLRILGVHGWLDNANTFDTLAPFLPMGTELLVLDLPGHGHSDHLPVGAHYDILSYVLHLKRAVDKCRWDKFILVGHSMGACISNVFTSLFPEQVIAFVSLDYIRPRKTTIDSIQQNISVLFKGETLRKQKPVVYSEEQAIERLIKARTNLGINAAIDRDAAYVLLPRSARQVEGGYAWSHDPRARANFQATFGKSWYTYTSQIRCPVLIVAANHGIVTSAVREVFEEALAVYRSNAQWLDVVAVDGSHHVHLTHPKRVAKPLVAFLHRVVKETAPALPLQARL
ncbi:probable serine hydrolase isoform X1 [Portunus trituberculatus]|uniref:probable serine hydrolase isoform X1 n=2 Tax=Portunus trituberculatus TaxID=210409 RepID=UPI001E1D2191|nr:probable serine hydrolase isoform X1 [Portunus trituberculatus]